MTLSPESLNRLSPQFLVEPFAEATPRWIRVKFGGKIIADSKQAIFLRQYGPGRLPTYYFPQADVRMEVLMPRPVQPGNDGMEYRTLKVGDELAEDAAWIYHEPPAKLSLLKDYVSFAWDKMEGWYEEEEEIFAHARDPYHRVDVLASSRHVRVVIAGETVAETNRPYLLFETTLPARYYIPAEDVKLNLLESSSLKTRCAYKGMASYWSLRLGEKVLRNVVWSYPDPVLECPKIKDLLCFFNERVDIYVDDELQERPKTPWSEQG